MSKQLKIDTAELRDAAGELTRIRESFTSSEGSAENLRDALGHQGLADRVVEFSNSWAIRRGQMVEKIDTLTGFLTATADGLEKAESGLKDALARGGAVGQAAAAAGAVAAGTVAKQ